MKSFSKKIVFWTGLLFASQVVMANTASLLYKDTSIYVYTIPSTAAIFGASIIFYLNKAKMENLLKIKKTKLLLKQSNKLKSNMVKAQLCV